MSHWLPCRVPWEYNLPHLYLALGVQPPCLYRACLLPPCHFILPPLLYLCHACFKPYVGSTGGGCKGALRGYPFMITYIILLDTINMFPLPKNIILLLTVLHTHQEYTWSCSVLSENKEKPQPLNWRGRNQTGISLWLLNQLFASISMSRVISQGPTFMWRHLRGQ